MGKGQNIYMTDADARNIAQVTSLLEAAGVYNLRREDGEPNISAVFRVLVQREIARLKTLENSVLARNGGHSGDE